MQHQEEECLKKICEVVTTPRIQGSDVIATPARLLELDSAATAKFKQGIANDDVVPRFLQSSMSVWQLDPLVETVSKDGIPKPIRVCAHVDGQSVKYTVDGQAVQMLIDTADLFGLDSVFGRLVTRAIMPNKSHAQRYLQYKLSVYLYLKPRFPHLGSQLNKLIEDCQLELNGSELKK